MPFYKAKELILNKITDTCILSHFYKNCIDIQAITLHVDKFLF